jgi:hypothetical protein
VGILPHTVECPAVGEDFLLEFKAFSHGFLKKRCFDPEIANVESSAASSGNLLERHKWKTQPAVKRERPVSGPL